MLPIETPSHVSVCVRVGVRALSLTGWPIQTSFVYIYIYTFILFLSFKSVAISVYLCACVARPLSLLCSSLCSVIPRSKTPVVPPHFTCTHVATRQRQEKGKKKMSEYGTDRDESDRHESDSKRAMTGLRERSPRRPKRSHHRLMRNYADLPARRTVLCGSDTSTWRITMRT